MAIYGVSIYTILAFIGSWVSGWLMHDWWYHRKLARLQRHIAACEKLQGEQKQ